MLLSLLVAVTATAIAETPPWVVIVAGSNGFQNYRHQADACHAYQVALANGVPASQIITMLYDDVAGNEGNPFPGKLYNSVGGSDVYAGCVIDYKGSACSMETFFRVLHGNQTAATPRVLGSGAQDNVFIFYTDHGAPGYVTFPAGVAMHATDLSEALLTMSQLGKYGKLLFYMDACNTGSMFGGGLLKAPRALAVAAALATEESYAAYCPPYDKVAAENGREVFSCLGDVMSLQWMFASSSSSKAAADDHAGHAAGNETTTATVGSQIDVVANRTATGHVLNRDHNSHVQAFGDMSIRDMAVAAFQGAKAGAKAGIKAGVKVGAEGGGGGGGGGAAIVAAAAAVPRTSARDVALVLARHKVAVAAPASRAAAAAARELADVLASRARADRRFSGLGAACGQPAWVERAVPQPFLEDRATVACYKGLLDATAAAWGAMDDYALRYSGLLANLCGERGAAAEQCVRAAVAAVDDRE